MVNVSGTFDASFVQSLHVGSKLTAEWTVPATSTATPCYAAFVPSGSKVLRILTKPGESAEDANPRAGHSKPSRHVLVFSRRLKIHILLRNVLTGCASRADLLGMMSSGLFLICYP